MWRLKAIDTLPLTVTAWKNRHWKMTLIGTCSYAKIIAKFKYKLNLRVSGNLSFRGQVSLSLFVSAVTIISVLLLLATVVVYSFIKELKTVPGKLALCFAISYLIAQMFLPIVQIYESPKFFYISSLYLLLIGFTTSFVCMSLMSFDIWWLFR